MKKKTSDRLAVTFNGHLNAFFKKEYILISFFTGDITLELIFLFRQQAKVLCVSLINFFPTKEENVHVDVYLVSF